MKTLYGCVFALALTASALFVSPKPALADNEYPSCNTSDSLGYIGQDQENDAEYDDTTIGVDCSEPDPGGGLGD